MGNALAGAPAPAIVESGLGSTREGQSLAASSTDEAPNIAAPPLPEISLERVPASGSQRRKTSCLCERRTPLSIDCPIAALPPRSTRSYHASILEPKCPADRSALGPLHLQLRPRAAGVARLDLSNAADSAILERVGLLDAWETATRARLGRTDTALLACVGERGPTARAVVAALMTTAPPERPLMAEATPESFRTAFRHTSRTKTGRHALSLARSSPTPAMVRPALADVMRLRPDLFQTQPLFDRTCLADVRRLRPEFCQA